MREALAARSDDDFIVEKTPRPPRGDKAGSRRSGARPDRAEPGWSARIRLAALRYPREIAATLILAGCGGWIAYNALEMQRSNHPAPLFRKPVAEAPAPAAVPTPPHRAPAALPAETPPVTERPAPERPGAVQPQGGAAGGTSSSTAQPASAQPVPIPPRPAPRGPSGDAARNGPDAPTPSAPRSQAGGQPRPVAPDPIADMIRMGGPVPIPPALVGKAEPDDRVAAAQRALVKLGYAVKIDGLAGAGTRQAIEAFERDRRLTVTGDLTQRTIRELAVQSGMQIP